MVKVFYPLIGVCFRSVITGENHDGVLCQSVRIQGKLGMNGSRLLRREPFPTIKCFHAGGQAKNWLAESKREGFLDTDNSVAIPGKIHPFVEISRKAYEREQNMKKWLATLGYYSLFPTS